MPRVVKSPSRIRRRRGTRIYCPECLEQCAELVAVEGVGKLCQACVDEYSAQEALDEVDFLASLGDSE